MPYDHRTKAGNQGDVVKHVALLAAVRHALDETRSAMRYADAYAGPAGSLLLPGGEWSAGIGKLNRSAESTSVDVGRWMRWYLARPQLVGSRYPGSALIVSDAAAEARKPLAMSLWDIAADVVADLRQVFPNHTVHHSPIDATLEAIVGADLLFIDPPALADQWALVVDLMSRGRHMLAWLPVNAAFAAGPVKVSSIAEDQFKQVCALPSVSCTRVLWPHSGRTIGCLLAYRSTPEGVLAIRSAVEEVVNLCSWKPEDIEHVDAQLDSVAQPAAVLDGASPTELVAAPGEGPGPALDHGADDGSAAPVDVSLICGDSHSFWLSHQGADEKKNFKALADLLQASPSRSRRCDITFDSGTTWISLVLRLVSGTQISWKGHNANASAAARVRALIRA